MPNKTLIGGVLVVAAIGGIAFVATRSSTSSPAATGAGVYCSPDGTLTDTMSIQSHRSYCLQSDPGGTPYAVNAGNKYSFSIVDDQGATLKDFAITHTKPMHVIVVRKDLANFQHVHPDYDPATGVFTLTDLAFPSAGAYRIFADFAPSGGMKDAMGMPLGVTIFQDVTVGANYSPQALGAEEEAKTFDGYQVSLATHGALPSGAESMLMFTISQSGKPLTDLQEYLGALGHSVILREGTLDFIHAHPLEKAHAPQDGKIHFMVGFPLSGKYKIFTQFQRNGKVYTTDFVVSVKEGLVSPKPETGNSMMH